MISLWKDNISLPSFESLKSDKNTDVLIIGGGMCGILCAHMLKQAGVDYMLLESEKICSKTTQNTTAKITSQHGFIYEKLIKEFNADFARLYLEANEEAIEAYSKLCAGIDCDFERKSAYAYSLNDEDALFREYRALKRLGYDAELCKSLNLPFSTQGAIKFKNQAQFNPLKFIAGIAKGLNIYENSHVRELARIKNGEHSYIAAKTAHAQVKAKKVIIATHFPIINKHGFFFLKMFQERSYVIALKGAGDVDGMYIDGAGKGLSFRNYGELLLLGGGGHRTGKQGGSWHELERVAGKYYPEASLTYEWATQDCMTLDGVPYIGQYSKATPNFFVATGFNKWGMSSSMVASCILCDLVCEKSNRYAEIFSPSRSILRPQLAINTLEALKGWLTISNKKCPHLGCTLKWNKYEHSWDCPCHGSRFKSDGTVLDNPANGSLKKPLE